MKKTVFRICDQVRLQPACSAIETSQDLEILDTARRGIVLSRRRTTKVLSDFANLHLCCLHMAKTSFLMMWLKQCEV